MNFMNITAGQASMPGTSGPVTVHTTSSTLQSFDSARVTSSSRDATVSPVAPKG
jgi:hypothetical protein